MYLKAPHCFVKSDAITINNEINSITLKEVIVSYKFYFANIDGPEIRNYVKLRKNYKCDWLYIITMDIKNYVR